MSDGIGMDCSIIESKKYRDFYIISTTDFFYPLIQDPYIQGRIACANVLSDMYAFGIANVDNMLMLLAASLDMKPDVRNIVTKLMIKGFNDCAKEAGVEVTGGQSVLNPWPIIGGVAKSICQKSDFIRPVSAVAGDVIVLTKALGTQVAVNVKQWMSNESKWLPIAHLLTTQQAQESYLKAQSSMSRLNKTAAHLMIKYGAHAATDVTGFGLLGHAKNLASNQEAEVSFRIHSLICLKHMLSVDSLFSFFKLRLGYSAETSGGLFICLPSHQAQAFCREIEEMDGQPAWIIGDVVQGSRDAFIIDQPNIVEV